jgi:hypothetical protein
MDETKSTQLLALAEHFITKAANINGNSARFNPHPTDRHSY